WHVANRVIAKNQSSYRILLNQITRDAVLNAVNNKGQLDMNKVNAQQARRVLDRLVGYKVSPFLWKTIYKGLSAGRVQSVALRQIVERDAEIEVFVPEEYWNIIAALSTEKKEKFKARLVNKNGKAIKIKNSKESSEIVKELSSLSYHVKDITKKKTKKNPNPPFITSTLQQEAARRASYTVARTMSIAQSLYEGVELSEGSVGLITYMRTDSTRVAAEAIYEARDFIAGKWGNEQLPAKPNYYKSRKNAQDAHEAIRPTSVKNTPEDIKHFLTSEQFKLYTIIWNRFVASQMKPAKYTNITVNITAGDYELRASDSHLDYEGFLEIYKDLKKDDDEDDESMKSDIPKTIASGDNLYLIKINPS
ncbi:unnamed protein product, partial [marine sediment metagenome]